MTPLARTISFFVLGLAACSSDSKLGGTETIPAGKIDTILHHFNRGIALMDRYQPNEAIEQFDKVVKLAPKWSTGRLNLGIALLNAQKEEAFVRAEEELKKVAAADPRDPFAPYALATMFRHNGRMEEAQKLFERVLELDPKAGYAHYQLAVVLTAKQPEKARRHLERTLELIPHHESACYRLQGMLRQIGENERANALLQRFQALKTAKAGVTSAFKYGEMGPYAEVVRTFGLADRGTTDEPEPTTFADRSAEFGLELEATGEPGFPTADRIRQLGRKALGPALAVADLDNDGSLDAVMTDPARGVLALRGDAGKLVPHEAPGLVAEDAVGVVLGDYDADGDVDAYVTCEGRNQLLRNDGDFRFQNVTEATKTAGAATISIGAQWADADHDGDLDIFVANYGAPNALYRNNGNGTFTDVAREAGIDDGDAATLGVVFFDADADRDVDLYVIHDGAKNTLYLNDRVGEYSKAPASYDVLADAGPGTGALVGDVDGNGFEDLLLLRGAAQPVLFTQLTPGVFTADAAFSKIAPQSALNGAFGDWDLDGDLDAVLFDGKTDGGYQHVVLWNRGDGRMQAVPLGESRPVASARGAIATDFDGDGALEVVIARAAAKPEVWRTTPPAGRHWLELLPVRKPGKGPGLEPTAAGLLTEIKTGQHMQLRRVQTASGFLSSPPLLAHFGLPSGKVDYARMLWSDSVLQSEIEVPGDSFWRAHRITRKPSSCPIIFTWNGERFEYITDCLGVGGVGFFAAPGEYAPPDPTEAVRIPPESIRPKDGRYLLRLAEPLEEVTYLDQLELRVYDHPKHVEIYPDERFAVGEPFPTAEPRAVQRKVFPVAARTDRQRDVLAQVLAIDRDYVEPPKDPRFVGYARDHWLELDFGNQVKKLTSGNKRVLYLYSWVEYTYSHKNYAAYQAGIAMQPPVIEVPNADSWRIALPNAGFPAGLPRMMCVDVTDLPLAEDGRLRLRTNMEVFWDQAFLAEDVEVPEMKRYTLQPTVADLRSLGYPREYSPDGKDPTVYDYHRVDRGVSFKTMTGAYTKFGDVRPLLREVDDKFVIIGKGEEVVLEFDARRLPPLAENSRRTVVLYLDGFCKDMDLYTAFPDTVGPLPFHAMKNYPPQGPPPNAAALEKYQRQWNTRKVSR